MQDRETSVTAALDQLEGLEQWGFYYSMSTAQPQVRDFTPLWHQKGPWGARVQSFPEGEETSGSVPQVSFAGLLEPTQEGQ